MLNIKKRFFFLLILIALLSVASSFVFGGQYPPAESATKGATQDENLFKEAVLEIEKFKNEEKQGMEPIPFTDWWADNEKMTSAFNKLKTVVEEYPNSEWADDALYLHAYLMSPEPQDAVNQLNRIIENYPDGKFKQWTLENCSTVTTVGILKKMPSWTLGDQAKSDLALLYDTYFGEYRKALDLQLELIKKYKNTDYMKDRRAIFMSYLDAIRISIIRLGDVSKAEDLLNEFISKYPNEYDKEKEFLKTNFEKNKNMYEKTGKISPKPREYKKLTEPEKRKTEELIKFIEEPLKKKDTKE
jgi:tetratricopeptide (TPR) repeat protein